MRIALILCLSFCLSGCAMNSIFINYPSQIQPLKQALRSQSAPKLDELADNINGKDGLLYAQEAGRIAQVSGNFTTSKNYYQSAINAYQAFDEQAKVSLSNVGANATSLVLNDNSIPYRGPGFERIMLHQYQAFNYLFSGDLQGALVEVRRSNELQASEQKRYQKSQKSVQSMANGAIDNEVNRLSSSAGTVTSSFLNAYSYYITGLLHELLGEPNDAFIDYRKAAQISPNNPSLQQDLVRLAEELGMDEYEDYRRRWGEIKKPKADEGQVVVIVERGFVPEKQSITIPFRLHDNWQTASMATYANNGLAPMPSPIYGLPTPLNAAPIANIDALAINALKEDLPAALVRQALRVYTKSEMARRVRSDSKNRHNELDPAAILMQIFNVVSEQADRRSWLTLPRQAQIAKQYLPAGSYPLRLTQASGINIQVETNRTTLVWVIETAGNYRYYSIIL
ncbi:COG3014 family protein [Shewanella sp. SR44-3]|uniref:COG3014 family protein n=1 Tax=unclassified Shewanella TaxID=196818 RepID=UPI0015FC7B18|nr:hypothetical protein [Shewanella sp. SR44-3]MBB1268596.1 hypothetical protein [Shewanella sp. SR44-3]